MTKTRIEWTDEVWNPVTGCTKVSQGCKHCYAERVFPRPYPGRAFTDVQTHPDRLDQPLRWQRPRRVFVNSMSDLFHEAVPNEFLDQVFAVMALAPQHTFQVLTKRPARMQKYLTAGDLVGRILRAAHRMDGKAGAWLNADHYIAGAGVLPLHNVWLGVSVEDQETADERIPLLLQTPAAVRWISAEPLLGPVDLRDITANLPDGPAQWDALQCNDEPGDSAPYGTATLDWVVVGGESGPHARPMHPAWARGLRDQCVAAGVPFLFKQWGEWIGADQDACPVGPPESRWMWGDGTPFKYSDQSVGCTPLLCRAGKKAAGRLLDGELWDQYPV